MQSLVLIFFLLTILMVGFFSLRSRMVKNNKKIVFSVDFLKKLKQYIESQGRDGEVYAWLIHRSNKMQLQMGGYGILKSYSPPYARYRIENYPLILNIVPALREAFSDQFSSMDNRAQSCAATLHEGILRYIGVLDDTSEAILGKIKNPFIWFTAGIGLILEFPILVLFWFGIIGNSSLNILTSSWFFRTLVSLASLISFFSAIVGLVTGWDQFVILTKLKPFITSMSEYFK